MWRFDVPGRQSADYMLTTFMRHASAETSTICYMNGFRSGGSSSQRCKIEWNGQVRHSRRESGYPQQGRAR
jgi:hypothetical protein